MSFTMSTVERARNATQAASSTGSGEAGKVAAGKVGGGEAGSIGRSVGRSDGVSRSGSTSEGDCDVISKSSGSGNSTSGVSRVIPHVDPPKASGGVSVGKPSNGKLKKPDASGDSNRGAAAPSAPTTRGRQSNEPAI